MPAAQRKMLTIPLVSGLQTKGDRRAVEAPSLDIATDVEFDDLGGLRLRFPFGPSNSNITSGGTLTNCRKLAYRGSEFLVFTETALYAWADVSQSWTYRGDHPAVMTDEETVFAAPGDQYYGDRVEYGGVVFYTWQNNAQAFGASATFLAVMDPVDGSVLATVSGLLASQPRLVAIDSGVLLFAVSGVFNELCVYTLTYAAGVLTISGAAGSGLPVQLGVPTSGGYFFDACSVPGQNRALVALTRITTTAGKCWSIDHTGAITASSTFGNILGVESAPIALTVSADAAVVSLAYVRGDSGGSVFDIALDTCVLSLAPNPPLSNMNIANEVVLGSYATSATLSQVTIVTIPNGTGSYKTFAFWSIGEVINAVFASNTNTAVLTTSTGVVVAATAAVFVYALGIATKAFALGTHAYVTGVFAGISFDASDVTGTHSQLQNTYYLYRDDGLVIAQATWGEAGGFQNRGFLPTVSIETSNANEFKFLGQIRRIVPVAANALQPVTGTATYAERALREVTFTFDDDRARRSVQIGDTLYITGGLVLQYDGAQLVEVGTLTYPWLLTTAAGSSGAIPAGGYSYKASDRWNNAAGEIDRSTTATVGNVTLPGSTVATIQVPSLYITRKTNVAVEVWRTVASPAPGVPFFLDTSQDPSVTSGDNAYLTSAPTSAPLLSLTDDLLDAALSVGPANPENNGVLQNLEPPPASIIMTDAQRIYLAGIAGYPNTVYYSKYKQAGLVVAFSDYLSFTVPAAGGAIVALGYLDGGLVVWCETATYQFAGPGYDDTGNGSNFALVRKLPETLGAVSQDAIGAFDDGWLVKTSKGWYVLGKDLNYTYVGTGAYTWDSEAVLATEVLTTRHQIRVQTTARTIMFDTLVKQWAMWTVVGIDATIWNGTHAVLTSTGPMLEQGTYDDVNYGLDIETAWIKPNDQQGRIIVDYFGVLGEFRSPFSLRVRMASDYIGDGSGGWFYHTDTFWDPYPAIAKSSLQMRAGPTAGYSRCESFKIRLTAYAPDHASAPTGPCARMTSIALQYADEPGLFTGLNPAQKV